MADLSADEVGQVFATATTLKAEYPSRAAARSSRRWSGRTLAMLFQKPSLRTRVTFEAGMAQLGGSAIYLTNDVVLGARESVRDVARNLERFVDAIVARTGPHEVVTELAAHASIPVINGLTLREHPCQALADVFTIGEHLGRLAGVKVAFVGDGNNVYHSLALLGVAMGMEVRLAHPQATARTNGSWPGRRHWQRRPAGGSCSVRIHTRSCAVRTSCTRMRGRPWARKPRLKNDGMRSPVTEWTTPCSMRPGRAPWPCIACRHIVARRSRRRSWTGPQPDPRPVGEPAARPEGAARRAARDPVG